MTSPLLKTDAVLSPISPLSLSLTLALSLWRARYLCRLPYAIRAIRLVQHAGVSGPPRVQLGARAAAGMLQRRARMEGAEERRHRGFTGRSRAEPKRARDPGGQRQQ